MRWPADIVSLWAAFWFYRWRDFFRINWHVDN